MPRIILLLAALIFGGLMASPAAADEPKYDVGQVWEFEAKGVKPGGLLVVQQVDPADGDENTPIDIYHISIVAELVEGFPNQLQIAHLPVSQQTLDMSVTELSDVELIFAGWEPGWAEWQKAQGGVFTISLSDIITMLTETMPEAPKE